MYLLLQTRTSRKRLTDTGPGKAQMGRQKNQIDFILSSQKGIVNDCEAVTIDIGSDHRMVRATIKINRKLARLKFIKNKRKKCINLLRLREKQQDFQIKLYNRFHGLEVDDIWT